MKSCLFIRQLIPVSLHKSKSCVVNTQFCPLYTNVCHLSTLLVGEHRHLKYLVVLEHVCYNVDEQSSGGDTAIALVHDKQKGF